MARNYDPTSTYDNGSCEPCGCRRHQRRLHRQADVLLLLAEFGCVVDCSADIDEDNTVSVSDLLFLLSNYGLVCL